MDWNALTDTFSGIKMNSVEHSEVGNDESANDASESSPPMPDGLIAHLILAYSHPHPNTHNRALALQVSTDNPTEREFIIHALSQSQTYFRSSRSTSTHAIPSKLKAVLLRKPSLPGPSHGCTSGTSKRRRWHGMLRLTGRAV